MKQNSKEIYILDTSALFSYIEDEEGSDIVENLLIEAENKKIVIWIAFVSLTEVFYITLRERGEAEAKKRLELIQSLSVAIEESNEDLNLRAARFKAKNRISLADAYIAALCQHCPVRNLHVLSNRTYPPTRRQKGLPMKIFVHNHTILLDI